MRQAKIQEVRAAVAPPASGRWCPIPLGTFIDTLEKEIAVAGHKIVGRELMLEHGQLPKVDGGDLVENARLFAWFGCQRRGELATVFAAEHSVDKSCASRIFAGVRVVPFKVCGWVSEAYAARRQTAKTLEDLGVRVQTAIDELDRDLRMSSVEIEKRYFTEALDDYLLAELLVRCAEAKSITAKEILTLKAEVEHPTIATESGGTAPPMTAIALFLGLHDTISKHRATPSVRVRRSVTAHGICGPELVF